MSDRMKRKRLGDMLLEAGIITQEQLSEALREQLNTNRWLGQILIDKNFVKEHQIIKLLEIQTGYPLISLSNYYVEPSVPLLISEALARQYELIPVKKEGNKLIVAMADPLNIIAIDNVQTATGLIVEPAISAKADISKAIGIHYSRQNAERAIEEYRREYGEAVTEDEEEDQLNNAPIVRLVNTIITQAVRNSASDIHIEPFDDEVIFRIRVDGILQQVLTSVKSTHAAIVARIKIMSGMDIAEKRHAQDGRIETVIEGSRIDMRVSSLPTVFGEKIVIRLLYRNNTMISKSSMGFSASEMEVFDKIIKSPVGIVLVTGPTGSGKSTTLYAILDELKSVEKNIITVEDPVEYMMKGISQVQVNAKAGMDFAGSLRTILRQDPDIIMIGEIRDAQTCEIAIRASITGHLVLSTIHTNDTASTITRLIDMGVEPFLVSAALIGIVAQRLVRKICPVCKAEIEPADDILSALGVKRGTIRAYEGKGCVSCRNTGYSGRTAAHEILPVTKEIRELISRGSDADKIRDTAVGQGMSTLLQSCLTLVNEGTTTLNEAMRVAYNI